MGSKVIFAGGGTGGHLYPGVAVAERVSAMGVDVLFLVSNRGIERRILEKKGWDFVEQDVAGFSGVSLPQKVMSIQKLSTAAKGIKKYIDKGDKILLLGGFAAAPAAFVGEAAGADIYIHEQNSVMGLVNKLMSFRARKIFTSYQKTHKAPSRAMLVGNPVRGSFLNSTVKGGFDKRILVVGGSSGSRVINKQIISIADKLLKMGYTIFHQTGDKLYEDTLDEYGKLLSNDNLIVEAYIDDMKKAYEDADIVISRSGSGAVFETTYSRRPAIYIPFAQATGDHQYYNAMNMAKERYCKVLQERELQGDKLLEAILDMADGIDIYKDLLKGVTPLDSAELIIKAMGIKR